MEKITQPHLKIKKYVFVYILAIILVLLRQIISGIGPLILNILVDGAILGQEVKSGYIKSFLSFFLKIEKGFYSIIILSTIILIFYFIGSFMTYLSGILNAIATENIINKLRLRLHESIQRFTYAHYMKEETGDLLQRCTSNLNTIKNTFSQFIISGIGIIFSIFYVFAIMLSQNIKMTIFSSCAIPVIFISSVIFMIYIKKQYEIVNKKEALMIQVAQENLTGVRVVKAFSMQEYEMKKFEKVAKDYRDIVKKVVKVESIFWALCDGVTLAQIMFVTLYGSYLAYLGEITVGQVFSFGQYITALIFPIRQLARIISNFGRLSISIKRIKEVLNAPKENIKETDTINTLKGDLSFNHVSFSYPSSKEHKVLTDVSFKIKEGEMLGIIGMTGSGKTSLMYLLERLYSCDTGNITIDNVDIANIDLFTLRKHIGIVLQEPFLYSKTIKENIKISSPEATDEQVIEVAKEACLHKDIMEFENGYDTIVGENGVTLSGGQKQRLAIARTLLKNASIIIFDDSLSSVDTTTDAQIRESINKIRGDKILIVISHRLSSVLNADKIIVLEDGKISQEGRHEELLNQEGLYKRIYEIQNAI